MPVIAACGSEARGLVTLDLDFANPLVFPPEDFAGIAVLRVDDHASAVCDGVWELYARAAEHFGPLPTLIEWDNDVPVLSILLAEARKADEVMEACSHAPR